MDPMEASHQFVEQVRQRLEKWREEVRELDREIDDISSMEKQNECLITMRELQRKALLLETQSGKAEVSSDENWADFKQSLAEGWEDLRAETDRAKEQIHAYRSAGGEN